MAFLSQHAPGTVVDLGCGWAALLTRLLAANPEIRGIGIDLSTDAIEHGRRLAEASAIADRLELVCGDARERMPAAAQGAICIGASQIWGAPVEAGLPLDYSAALAALRRLVGAGAPVVYGEAIWSATPTKAAVAPLAGRLDEFVSMAELLNFVSRHGFRVVHSHEAGLDEWDEFEAGHVARYESWLAEHPGDHPDAPEVRKLAARQRDGYSGGYRGILGMAYLSLVAE